jgi:hypothetical protein
MGSQPGHRVPVLAKVKRRVRAGKDDDVELAGRNTRVGEVVGARDFGI